MRYIYSLALGVFLLGSVSAQAVSPRGDDFYGSIFVGTSFVAEDQAGSFNRVAGADNRYEAEGDPGYYVGGSFGGWINGAQRMDISIGYRSYGATFTGAATATEGISAEGDITLIPVMFNNYFYPLYFWNDAIPAMAQNFYLGFGVGVGLWEFDVSGTNLNFDTSYGDTQSVLLQGSLGYEFYLGDLEEFGMAIPDMLDGMSFGVNYQFIWGNPKPEGTRGTPALAFSNERLHQRSHALLFTARYDF